MRWRAIKGYEGIYEISDDGTVRSLTRRDSSGRKRIGRILKPVRGNRFGHLAVSFSKGGKHKQYYIHRLVMEAFVGPCPEGMEVCHYPDHDPSNNCLDNLMYGTHSENHFQSTLGNYDKRCKPVVCEDGREFVSASEAGRQTGINNSNISTCCTGKQQTAGTLKWRYK